MPRTRERTTRCGGCCACPATSTTTSNSRRCDASDAAAGDTARRSALYPPGSDRATCAGTATTYRGIVRTACASTACDRGISRACAPSSAARGRTRRWGSRGGAGVTARFPFRWGREERFPFQRFPGFQRFQTFPGRGREERWRVHVYNVDASHYPRRLLSVSSVFRLPEALPSGALLSALWTFGAHHGAVRAPLSELRPGSHSLLRVRRAR